MSNQRMQLNWAEQHAHIPLNLMWWRNFVHILYFWHSLYISCSADGFFGLYI